MKFRAVIAAAIVAGVALGTSGCNLIQPQATTKSYNASDGVAVQVGTLNLQNLIVISNDGELASLMLTGVNTTGKDQVLTINYVAAGVAHSVSQIVPSSDQRGTTWGGKGEPQIILEQIATAPGSMMEIAFAADGGSVSTLVPVLTTAQPEYNGLEPVAPLKASN